MSTKYLNKQAMANGLENNLSKSVTEGGKNGPKTTSANSLLASSISNNALANVTNGHSDSNNNHNFSHNNSSSHHHHHHTNGHMPKSATTLTLFNNQVDFSSMDESEKKTVAEFIHLLEKSRQLFNGLRELPQYGHKSNQWQAYFGRTFDVYTKLWKFQQQHRAVLDSKYHLKRWQIGEIASKIGQLYYHYYLRTSESNYLNESYSFYQAIQTRAYYSKANKEEKPDLMVKKLRYFARFIVVCLLLKKNKQVKELIRELSKQIDDYVKIYDPADQLEWQMVKNEINEFIDADNIVNVENITNAAISNRLNVSLVPKIGPNPLMTVTNDSFRANSTSASHLHLQEILIIGNCLDQIKFSELSLDMFRMLQAVEREPTGSTDDSNDKSPATHLFLHDNREKDSNTTQSILQRENPHKYLLYKPSFSQIFTYLSAAFKDLTAHGVMMIYLSADSCDLQNPKPENPAYDLGGVRTNNKKELSTSQSNSNVSHHYGGNLVENMTRKSSNLKELHCIYPGDLYPFLRKPLFLIVDSLNSAAFKNFPNLFGQPFVCLLSPTHLPNILLEHQNQQGSLFTIFMTNPLFAFCYICNITRLNSDTYNKCQELIKYIFVEIAKAIHKSKQMDSVVLQFCQDDFLRVFILRYIFCYASLKMHRGFKGENYYPSSQPSMPKDVVENKQILGMIIDLAAILGMRQLFLDILD